MNKRSFLSLTLLIISSLLLTSCGALNINVTRGSGELTTQSRDVSDFDSLQIDGAGELIITQSGQETLEIRAEDNIIDELTSDVEGNTLILGYRESFLRNAIIPTERITYMLSVKDLSRVTINGAADMNIDSLDTDSLALIINGAGNISITQLSADVLSGEISGASSIEIGGQAQQQSIEINGTGNYRAGDLQTSSTTIEINGLGNATVWATETLNISIDGGGNLRYYGSPNVTQEINGLGDIDNLGEK